MRTIAELQARLAELNNSAQSIRTTAANEKRDFNADEQENLDSIFAEFDATEAEIARLQGIEDRMARASSPQPRAAAAAQPGNDGQPAPAAARPANAGPRARGSDGLQHTTLQDAASRGRWGWNTLGDFANAVRVAASGGQRDTRLLNAAASTYGTEDIGADGGFSVPPDWRNEIMVMVNGEDSLFGRTDNVPLTGNQIVFPIDESTPWSSSGGIQAYWSKEAAAYSQSKPVLQELTARLDKLTALVPVTQELLEDSAAMGSYLPRKAGQKLNFKVNDAIINGDGAGMPLGIMNAPCLVTVSKEGSQGAASLIARNVIKMYSRMPAANRARAFWLINQDIEPELLNLNITFKDIAGTAGIAAGAAAYLPPGGLSGSPYATLMGRPILPTEACATLGTTGDIIFADLGAYLTISKAGGIRAETSLHLWFDQDLAAFKFTMRCSGRPWLSAPITRKNGSNTLSPFVALETR